MGSEQPIHIKTSAHCSASNGEDNDEIKEMLSIMVFPLCLCPGAAWGAWKHAPIIPLPNYHALILHAHPIFFSSKLPPVSALVG